MAVRIKANHLPMIKKQLITRQNGKCPLCGRDITRMKSINVCVDHDHETGLIRAALCRTCNGNEGKIKNLAVRCVTAEHYQEFIHRLSEYYKLHEEPQTEWTHHTHLSEVEKRAKRNKQARDRYAKKKKAQAAQEGD